MSKTEIFLLKKNFTNGKHLVLHFFILLWPNGSFLSNDITVHSRSSRDLKSIQWTEWKIYWFIHCKVSPSAVRFSIWFPQKACTAWAGLQCENPIEPWTFSRVPISFKRFPKQLRLVHNRFEKVYRDSYLNSLLKGSTAGSKQTQTLLAYMSWY